MDGQKGQGQQEVSTRRGLDIPHMKAAKATTHNYTHGSKKISTETQV